MKNTRRNSTKQHVKTPREVVRVITDREIINWWRKEIEGGVIEVREHRKGHWTVHYPEEGWIPCPANCTIRHTHATVRPFTELSGSFEYDAAVEMAYVIAGQRDVQIKTLEKAPPKCSYCSKPASAVVEVTKSGATGSYAVCIDCEPKLPAALRA